MVAPLNSRATVGESLGMNLDFYTIASTVSFAPGAATDASQLVLDQVVQTISLNGQPVLLNYTSPSSGNHLLSFAIEHQMSWGSTPEASVAALTAALVATELFEEDDITVSFAVSL